LIKFHEVHITLAEHTSAFTGNNRIHEFNLHRKITLQKRNIELFIAEDTTSSKLIEFIRNVKACELAPRRRGIRVITAMAYSTIFIYSRWCFCSMNTSVFCYMF
jgi:hypothetical protein